MQETKEGDSPCGLSITATDFYVYVRDKYFFVYVLGGKERKRRKKTDNPCELPSKDFCGYVRDTDFSAHVEGRKERELLWITDTDFCAHISTSNSYLALPSFFPKSFVFES